MSKVEAMNLLWSLQSSYMRAAVGSTGITPTEAVEAALCLTPLILAVIGAARFNAYRLKYGGEWRNMGLGYSKIEFLQKYPSTLKQDRVLKNQLVQQYMVLIRRKTGIYQVKLSTTMQTRGSRTGQELRTTLVWVCMN